jgi:transglutaminase-like putative cysteine protease
MTMRPDTRPATASAATPTAQGWLLAAAGVTLLPHLPHLPPWLSGLCALLLGWNALLRVRRQSAPPRALLVALTLACGVAVHLSFGHFFGRGPGVALLALLLCLKLLEVRYSRDIRAAILLLFFLQTATFLNSQSLPVAALTLVATLLSLTVLLAVADPGASRRTQFLYALRLLGQGLPFLLVLFVLFPRVQGPLWGLPADAHRAQTGLSGRMSPGSISALSRSGAIAFRAEFDGGVPAPAQRYWRGPVLVEYDGFNWQAAAHREADTPFYAPVGRRFDYRLTLEAHHQRWVLALELPGATAADASTAALRFTSDYQTLSRAPLHTRTRFRLSAWPDTRPGVDPPGTGLSEALSLPAGFNPRSRALAAQLKAGATSDAVVLQRVIADLRARRLVYTLQPALLGRDGVDDFLFETRAGFCEHFAAAFAVLMRAAGVPTRIVTGYQGGELNPVDGTLVIRQSDAHAWTEVWLSGQGWVRVDPTALAAPQRIESGVVAALADSSPLPLLLRTDLGWVRDLRHRWEALSNAWNQRVIGYNPERQRELLARLGIPEGDWTVPAALLGGTLVLLSGLLLAWALVQPRPRDPVLRSWAGFCARMARKGLARAPWEGPLDYGARLAAALPQQAREVQEIATLYARLRYGADAPPSAAAVRRLKRLIRQLESRHTGNR